jgi:hypothetical protein
VATLVGPFLRLVTEICRDGVVGYYGRCAEGVGIHERRSGRGVVVCGQNGIWDWESVAAQDVFEWGECEILRSNPAISLTNHPPFHLPSSVINNSGCYSNQKYKIKTRVRR